MSSKGIYEWGGRGETGLENGWIGRNIF